MRLRTIQDGTWRIVAPVGADDCCDVHSDLNTLAADPATQATAAKFRHMWRSIPFNGPNQLPDQMYRQLDARHGIYEFRSRNHRVLCFTASNRVVVCSHVILKAQQRTPAREKKRAINLKKAYEAAVKSNSVVLDG